MSDDPDAIRAEIEATRRNLSGDVDALADKVTPSSNGHHRSDLEDQLNPDNVSLQDNPYPQGDLP